MPLVEGRLFTDGDIATSNMVVLVNEAAAARFFPGRSPVGQQIRFWGASRLVVGVVGNERFHGIADAPPPATYAPLAQAPSSAEVLLVRAADPLPMASAVRAAIAKEDAGLALFGMEPLRDTLDESLGRRRFVMLLLAGLCGAGNGTGGHRHPRGAELRRVAANPRNRHSHGARRNARPGDSRDRGNSARLARSAWSPGLRVSLVLTRFLASLLFHMRRSTRPRLSPQPSQWEPSPCRELLAGSPCGRHGPDRRHARRVALGPATAIDV